MHILSDYNAVYNYSTLLIACQYFVQNYFNIFVKNEKFPVFNE